MLGLWLGFGYYFVDGFVVCCFGCFGDWCIVCLVWVLLDFLCFIGLLVDNVAFFIVFGFVWLLL